MSEPMSDERALHILEMQREAERAPELLAEVRHLREESNSIAKTIVSMDGEIRRLRFGFERRGKLLKRARVLLKDCRDNGMKDLPLDLLDDIGAFLDGEDDE